MPPEEHPCYSREAGGTYQIPYNLPLINRKKNSEKSAFFAIKNIFIF
jgi:hypothetical protein